MARYRRASSARRRTSRYTSRARGASRRSYRSRSTGRRSRSSSGGTIKLVIQTTASPVGEAQLPLGMKPAPRPKVARF